MRVIGDFRGALGRLLLAAVAVSLSAGASASSATISTLKDCQRGARPVASVEAAGARDGMTVRLKDGSEVRLAGVIAPTEFEGDAEAAGRATAALDALLAGRRLHLFAAKRAPDRHQRIVAQAVLADGDGEWIQGALVRAGVARVMSGAGVPDCAAALLALERQARAARAGLWGGTFKVEDAAAVPKALVAGGRFALVEADVYRVGESGGRLYLDFGRRYSEDFTIVIPREAQAAFAAAGVDLRALSGKRVRARGVLFSWGGPAMELRVPAALEMLGTD